MTLSFRDIIAVHSTFRTISLVRMQGWSDISTMVTSGENWGDLSKSFPQTLSVSRFICVFLFSAWLFRRRCNITSTNNTVLVFHWPDYIQTMNISVYSNSGSSIPSNKYTRVNSSCRYTKVQPYLHSVRSSQYFEGSTFWAKILCIRTVEIKTAKQYFTTKIRSVNSIVNLFLFKYLTTI